MASIWKEEMKDIREKKKLIYKAPLPKKKQRVTCPCELPGPVKVYSKEEIRRYESRTISG
jgi:hypothetical protein